MNSNRTHQQQDEHRQNLQHEDGVGLFDLLPREVWLRIIFFAAKSDLSCIQSLSQTCRSMSELTEAEVLWKDLAMKLPFFNVEEKDPYLTWKEWFQYIRSIKSICKYLLSDNLFLVWCFHTHYRSVSSSSFTSCSCESKRDGAQGQAAPTHQNDQMDLIPFEEMRICVVEEEYSSTVFHCSLISS